MMMKLHTRDNPKGIYRIGWAQREALEEQGKPSNVSGKQAEIKAGNIQEKLQKMAETPQIPCPWMVQAMVPDQ